MKRLLLVTLSAIAVACKSETPSAAQAAAGSPIEGNWELVENTVAGKTLKPKRTQQIKVFHDGFFSVVMYNEDGSFQMAGAGPYEVNGNKYKETFRYISDTLWIDSSDEQEWEMKGDTLVFHGFTKAVDKNGKDVTAAWGGDRFVEKRVRAKR